MASVEMGPTVSAPGRNDPRADQALQQDHEQQVFQGPVVQLQLHEAHALVLHGLQGDEHRAQQRALVFEHSFLYTHAQGAGDVVQALDVELEELAEGVLIGGGLPRLDPVPADPSFQFDHRHYFTTSEGENQARRALDSGPEAGDSGANLVRFRSGMRCDYRSGPATVTGDESGNAARRCANRTGEPTAHRMRRRRQ